jgi:hypothetical protein
MKRQRSEEAAKDARFAKVEKDKRFKPVNKKETKMKLDPRFKPMLEKDDFRLACTFIIIFYPHVLQTVEPPCHSAL